MKLKSNPFARAASLTASIVLSLGSSAFAADYQWNGTTTSTWSTAGNWSPAGTFFGRTVTAGPGPTGATFAHRLNVLNGANNALTYDGTLGTTVYANAASGQRGLTMSSGTAAPASSFTITGGSFSTLGSSAADAIGNSTTSGTTSVLTINGGTFIGSGTGTILNFGGTNNASTLNVLSGTATLTTLNVSQSAGGSGTVNLGGGTLEVNTISRSAATGTLNLNGGTLKARVSSTAFISGLTAVNAVSSSTIDTNSFDVSINSAISGSATINKINGGKLTLTANNPFTGNVVINAGTLALAPTAISTFAGNTSGAGALEIGGTSRVDLTGTNTHLGTTTVLSGASLGGEGSVSGALTFAGTSNFVFDPSTTGANQYFRAGSIDASAATISVVPSTSASGSGIVVMEAAGGITGTVGVNFLGSSRLALSFNPGNTQLLANYTPATLTWKGTDGTNPTFWDTGITANWDNGGSPDSFFAGDNVLFDDTASSLIVDVQAPLFPGNITFNNSTGSDYSVNGASGLGGGGNLTKTNSGWLYLNTPNSYTGTTTINDGRVVLGNNSALGATAGGTTVSGTGALDIGSRNLSTEIITISGAGDGSGALINNGADQINALGRLVLAGNATIGGTGRLDLRNSTPTLDMGGFTLTKSGLNYVGLVSVAVSNPGNINVSEGTFSIQNSSTMGGSSTNTISVAGNATLSSWNNETPVPWSISLSDLATLRSESAGVATHNQWSGPVTIAANGFVTIQADASMTVSGVISGTDAAITKTGTGATFLSGTNTYSGPTTVNAGGLVLQNTSALGTTTAGTTVASGGRVELDNITMGGEPLDISGDGGNFFGALQGRTGTSVWTSGVTVNSTLTRIGAQTGASLEVSGVISSPTTHTVMFRPADLTSTVILSGANTYTGPTAIAGGVVSVSNIGNVGGGPGNLGAPATVADGTIQMSILGATGALRYTGSGETTDRVINLAAATNGAYLDQSGTGLLKFTSDLTATGVGTKNLVLQGSTSGVGEFAGAIVDNLTGTNLTSVTKAGTGTWVLSGNNTFTGGVTINDGVLRITNSNALGAGTKNITINASANKWLELDGSGGNITLPANFSFFSSGVNGVVRNTAGDNVINGSFTMTIGNGNTKIISDNAGSLTLNGNIAANTTTRVLDFGGDSVANNAFNGVLSNASSPGLAKTGTGKWTLNGVNLYTGATTINGGTLVIGSTGSIDASTSLSVAAGAELDTTAKATHTLPAAVSIGLDGDTDTSGLIDATGQALDIDGATVTFNVTGTLDAPSYLIAKYSSISGASAFASITPPSGYAVDYGTGPTGEIRLVQSGTDYDDWMDLYTSITDPNDKLTTADPDGDGLTNQMEYAFGLAPNSGSSVNPILVQLDKTTGTFTYQRRSSTGLTYTVLSSTDLATWNPASASESAGTPDVNNVQTVTVTLTGAPLTADKLFVRVKAE